MFRGPTLVFSILQTPFSAVKADLQELRSKSVSRGSGADAQGMVHIAVSMMAVQAALLVLEFCVYTGRLRR